MSKFFLMVPHYFAFGTSPDEAWRNLQRESGHARRHWQNQQYFMLEFPTRTKVTVDEVNGGWRASTKPLRLVAHNLHEDRAKALRAMAQPPAVEPLVVVPRR